MNAAIIELSGEDAVMSGYDHANGTVRIYMTDSQLKRLIEKAIDARIALYINPIDDELEEES